MKWFIFTFVYQNRFVIKMRRNEKNPICRLCLTEKVDLIDVFESKGIPGWTAADAIKEFLRLQVSAGDIYPQSVCIECMMKLEDFKLFQQQCERNKDLLDRAYSGNRRFGETECIAENVLCSSEIKCELNSEEELVDFPNEIDPLDFIENGQPLKTDTEESFNDLNEASSTEVIGSVNQVFIPIKREFDYQDMNDPGGNNYEEFVNSVKEEATDIPAESISDECFSECIPGTSGNELTASEGNAPFGIPLKDKELSCSSETITDDLPCRTTLNNKGLRNMSSLKKRCCFVPNCKVNSETAPNKIFLSVPKNIERRRRWFEAVGKTSLVGTKMVCCEDHFNLESDCKNWMHYRMIGSRLLLKEDVVPHKFECCESPVPEESQLSSSYKKRKMINILKYEYSKASDAELTQSVNSNTSLSQKMTLCSSMICISSDVHSIGPQNNSKGPTGASRLSRVEDILGNDDEVPQSNLISSHTNRVPSSYNVSHDIESEQEPIVLSQFQDEYSIISSCHNQEKIHADERVFVCVKCFEKFPTSDHLGSHMLIHSGDNPFQQAECSKAVIQQSNVKTHMKAHSEEEEPLTCSECSETFSHKHTLRAHLFYSGGSPFSCNQCSMTFHCKNKLEAHVMTHSADRPFYCNSCSKGFFSKNKLKVHMRVHSMEKLFKCNQCSKSFSQKYALMVHMRIHSGERPYKCNQCSKSFSSNGNLNKHMTIHTGKRPFECKQCSKSFSTNSELRKHMRIHTGERPYECDQCRKSFSLIGNLHVHMRIHSGERPYHCSQCSKSFSTNGSLKKHLRIHSGEKPYECNQCSKSFSDDSTLKNHMAVHSDEKPFACSQCNKTFTLKISLNRHLKSH